MACFVVAVVPDSVAVVVCRSSASGGVLVRNWQISLCCFVLDVILIAADCWLIISSSTIVVILFFGHTSTFQLLDIQAGHRCRPSLSPPGYCLHLFWRIGFSTHWSSISHRVFVANSRSRAFRKSISAQYQKLYERALGGIRTHEADLYQARGYNLIRHRGSEWYRAGRPGGL